MSPRERLHLSARQVGVVPVSVAMDAAQNFGDLAALGINITQADAVRMYSQHAAWAADNGVAMDALTPTTFGPTSGTPVQFLQAWMPGLVRQLTAAMKIDELTGITTMGNWHDEEIVQGSLELTGRAVPYGDYTNIPLSSWNWSYDRRTIVRFEEGLRVGKLEEARASAMNVNSTEEKRLAAARALDLQRNRIGFLGYNATINRTYGFLNDPALPAYVNVPTPWSTATFTQITADIRLMMADLRTQMQGNFDPKRQPTILALPTSVVDFLTVTSTVGADKSVQEWLDENYPNMRIIDAPELDDANGGANVAYLYPETVNDSGSDGGRVWTQIVPTKFKLLGVENQAKALVEDYTNATAGVMMKRPYAIVRRSGL